MQYVFILFYSVNFLFFFNYMRSVLFNIIQNPYIFQKISILLTFIFICSQQTLCIKTVVLMQTQRLDRNVRLTLKSMSQLRPCKRQNFPKFLLLQNSKHVIFPISYVQYHAIIKWSEFHETNKTNKMKCFRTKTPYFWVKNPCSKYSVYTEYPKMADFEYLKPVRKYRVLVGSKFLQKACSY